jgi:hypothetical protein
MNQETSEEFCRFLNDKLSVEIFEYNSSLDLIGLKKFTKKEIEKYCIDDLVYLDQIGNIFATQQLRKLRRELSIEYKQQKGEN